MYELDAAFTAAVNRLAGISSFVDALMIWSSAIGVPILVAAVAAQWWARTERPHTRHVLVAAGLSFLAGLALNQLILLFVHRMRPYSVGLTHLIVAPSSDYSFPSDHATASFAIAAAFLLHCLRRRGLAFLMAALLISFSRVYIGTHYVSDVVGGAFTGIAAALLVRLLFRENSRMDVMLTRIW